MTSTLGDVILNTGDLHGGHRQWSVFQDIPPWYSCIDFMHISTVLYTLSVLCQNVLACCARAITLFLVFPWRVTYSLCMSFFIARGCNIIYTPMDFGQTMQQVIHTQSVASIYSNTLQARLHSSTCTGTLFSDLG